MARHWWARHNRRMLLARPLTGGALSDSGRGRPAGGHGGRFCSSRKPRGLLGVTSHQKAPIGGQVDEPLGLAGGQTHTRPRAFRA